MKQADDATLWSYLDGELRAREFAILEKRLIEEPDLKRRLEELRDMHRLLTETMPAIDTDKSTRRIVDGVAEVLRRQKNPKDT